MSTGAFLEPLWQLTPKFVRDNSTQEFRWVEQRSTNDASNKNIRIVIDDIGSYLLFSEAHVQVDFTVSANASIAETDGIAIPNAFALFDDIKLMVNNKIIPNCNRPGVVHHMVHSHLYSKDYAESIAETQMFYPLKKKDHAGVAISAPEYDDAHVAGYATNTTEYPFPVNDPTAELQYYLTANTTDNKYDLPATPRMRKNPKWDPVYARAVKRIADNIASDGKTPVAKDVSKCSVWLPLREIYPMLGQAFNRVNRGSKFEVQLEKTATMERVFYTATAPSGLTFDITKASVWVPRLTPELEASASIEAQIASNTALVEPYEKYEHFSNPSISAGTTTEQRYRVALQNSRVLRVYVGLQLDSQTSSFLRNPMQFESLGLQYIEARCNGNKYPLESYQTNSVGNAGKEGLVRMLRDVYATSNKTFDYENGSCIDFEGFVNGAQRIYMLDMTQADNSAWKKTGMSDLEIRYQCDGTASGVYTCHVVVVSEGEAKTNMLNGSMLLVQN